MSEKPKTSEKDRHWQSKNFFYFVIGCLIHPVYILYSIIKYK